MRKSDHLGQAELETAALLGEAVAKVTERALEPRLEPFRAAAAKLKADLTELHESLHNVVGTLSGQLKDTGKLARQAVDDTRALGERFEAFGFRLQASQELLRQGADRQATNEATMAGLREDTDLHTQRIGRLTESLEQVLEILRSELHTCRELMRESTSRLQGEQRTLKEGYTADLQRLEEALEAGLRASRDFQTESLADLRAAQANLYTGFSARLEELGKMLQACQTIQNDGLESLRSTQLLLHSEHRDQLGKRLEAGLQDCRDLQQTGVDGLRAEQASLAEQQAAATGRVDHCCDRLEQAVGEIPVQMTGFASRQQDLERALTDLDRKLQTHTQQLEGKLQTQSEQLGRSLWWLVANLVAVLVASGLAAAALTLASR